MIINEIIFWAISFIFLFVSIFWFLVLKLNDNKIVVKPKKLKEYPHITLIVPTMNGANIIVRTINYIMKQDYPKDKFDVIIATNNCTDNTLQIARALENNQIKVLDIKVPKGKMGKAYAFNQALKLAKGEIVACLDDDSILSPKALKEMVPLFYESEDVAIVVPGYKVYKPRKLIEQIQHIEYLLASVTRKLLETVDSLYLVHGVCCLYKKDILQSVDGFDEHSLTEDLEIAVRLTKMGYLVKSQLKTINPTQVPNTLYQLHRQRIRWTRGYYTTIFKHRDMLFNKEHGFLGMFVLPLVIFILAPILMFTTVYFLYNILRFIFVKWLSLISVPEYTITSALHLPSIFSVNSIWIIMGIMMILIFYMLKKTHFYMGEKFRFPFAVLIFITFYQSVLAAYWGMALIYELMHSRRSW